MTTGETRLPCTAPPCQCSGRDYEDNHDDLKLTWRILPPPGQTMPPGRLFGVHWDAAKLSLKK